MNNKEFITALETYYGSRYTVDIELKIITEFVKTHIPVDQVEMFFHKLTDHHSKKWKSLPDKAVMLECYEKHSHGWIEIQAEKAWRELIKCNTAHDVLITDKYAFFVIEGYGSWQRFTEQRDGEYRELEHKRFIDRYVSAARSGIDVTPRPLAGHYRMEYGPSFVGLHSEIIGDNEIGAALLSGKAQPTQIENLTTFIKTIE